MNDDLIPLLNKAYFFLKFRPRSEKEVRDYLYKKISTTHWSRDGAEIIIDKLKEQDLINDEKFVEWFIRHRNTLKPKGKITLTRELRQKGISDDLTENYFTKNIHDEEALAEKIITGKFNRFKIIDPKIRFQKVVSLLMRRGFAYDTAKQLYYKVFKDS